MKYLFIFFLNIWALSASSQYINWFKTYGGQGYDEAHSAVQLADSSYIVVGSTSSFYNSNQNILFLHIDSMGTFLNSNFINNGGIERGNKIIELNNKQFWISGYTNSFGNGGFDGYLVKTDSLGNKIEDFTYGGSNWDFFNDLIMLADSSLVIVGETQSFGAGNKDAYILRIDKYGDTIWTKTIGNTKDDWASSVFLFDDSLYVVGGTEDPLSDTTFGLFVKLDLAGNTIFEQHLGNTEYQNFLDINYYQPWNLFILTGDIQNGSDLFGWTLSLTSQGNIASDVLVGWTGGDSHIHATIIYPGQAILLHALTTNSTLANVYVGGEDAMVVKTNISGWFNDFAPFGHLNDDDANDIIVTSDGGALMLGTNRDISIGGSNAMVVKVGQQDSFPINLLDTINPITTSIKEYQFEILNFYPNPVGDQIYFDIENVAKEKYTFQLFNLNGALIKEETLLSNSINLSSISEGMYFLRVSSKTKDYRAKLIKSNE